MFSTEQIAKLEFKCCFRGKEGRLCGEISINIAGYIEKTAKLPILTRDKRENLYVWIKDFLFFNNGQITWRPGQLFLK